jgi:uncharacterized protein
VPHHDRVQVLALDGGGLRGLFSAHILACLERDLGVTIRDHFDLITGTSAGGLIALALGAGIPPKGIVDAYAQLAATVFPPRRRRNWPRRAFRPTYSDHALRRAVESFLGARVLADARTRLVIPAYDVARGAVHVFKTPHHPRLVRDGAVSMVDVARATAAAPTYFRATVVDDVRLVDGGLWASNPSVVGIAEAVSMLGAPLDAIRVLNIGTTDPVGAHPRKLDDAGVWRWATRIVPVTLTASARAAAGTAAHLVGHGDYVRIDAPVPADAFQLDRAHAGDLLGLASSVARDHSPVFTDRYADHVAKPFLGSATQETT